MRPGQVPTFAFFGAVHALLLSGTVHPLGEYYPSVREESARPPDDDADTALTAFAHEYESAIRGLLESRLVQTNHVQRAVGLQLGLAAIAAQVEGAPAHLLEIGSSAGLVLQHDQYGYQLGERRFGDRNSPVQLVSVWRSPLAVPTSMRSRSSRPPPASTSTQLDPATEADRLWLGALVWPEDRHKAELLRGALPLASEKPVVTLAGDAADLSPRWASALPAREPLIVFHCTTRMHVPIARRPAFDSAVESAGSDGPLYRIAIEGDGLIITGLNHDTIARYDVDGHLAWAKPH